MSKILDALIEERSHNGEPCYALSQILEIGEVRFLGDREDECIVFLKNGEYGKNFAVFQYDYADANETFMSVIWHGCGTTGNLRELRHSYFGHPEDNGYIFYVPLDLMEKAIKVLREFFNDR